MEKSNLPEIVQQAQKQNNSRFITLNQYNTMEEMLNQQIDSLNKKKDTYLHATDMSIERRFASLQEADKEVNDLKKDLRTIQDFKVMT
jgi:predicted RNase H-like nuclease (RuvC/YqgF family)